MSRLVPLLLLSSLILSTQICSAQLIGTKTVGGASPDYATISAAISALNTLGAGAGGVTFEVAAGHTETAANLTITTTTGSAASPIIFQRSGTGANPLITASAGSSSSTDGIIKIVGADYITFDGIDVTDPTTNTSASTRMEWGYAILKASAVKGCSNITIKNCKVTLQRAHTDSKGIYSANHTGSSTSNLTITAASGIHKGIYIQSNLITNCYSGIYSNGASNSTYYDDTLSFKGNQVSNFGGTTTAAYGVYVQNFRNAEVREDSISNTLSLTAGFLMYGVYTGNASDANISIVNNAIYLPVTSSNSTRNMTPVYCLNGGSTNTIVIDSNRMSNCAYRNTSGNSYVVYVSSPANTYIRHNQINGCTRVGSSGASYMIYTAGNALLREIGFNSITGYTSDVDGYGISIAAGKGDIFNNSISSCNISSTMFMIHTKGEGNIYENTITGVTCSGSIDDFSYIYADLSSGNLNIYKNTISSSTSSGSISDAWFMYVKSGASNLANIYENTISGNTHTGSTGDCFALFLTGCSANVYRNEIHTLNTDADILVGIELASGNVTYDVSRNKIYGFASSDNGTIVSGIRQSGASTSNINNNVIGLLRSGNSSTSTNGINGINIAAGTATNIYHNTVYLNATSSGGSNCIYLSTTPNTKVINNLLVNLSANGTNLNRSAVALKRSSATYSTYHQESDNNFFYVGATATNRYLYTDGTNSFQTISQYKTYAVNIDQASLSAPITFSSLTGSSPQFLNPADTTKTESAGKIIAGMLDDYLNDSSRLSYPQTGQLNGGGLAPDIGAHELDLIYIDEVPPTIQFTPIGRSLATSVKTLEATITDGRGVNVTPGFSPRLYFRKSSNSNTLAATNTSSDNGWKYVETYNTVSPFVFTIDYSLLYQTGTVADGDVIEYFVVAQDNSTPSNIGTNNATFSAPASSTNLSSAQFPVTGARSYQIKNTGLPGMITVGAINSDYSSLTQTGGLFEAINNGIVTNDITVVITSDLIENGAVALNKFAEDGFGSGTYRITIQPLIPVNYTISGSYTNGGLIRLVNVNRVTFDGGISGAGRYLTLINRVTNGSNAVFQIAGSSNNGGSNNVTIKNCNILADTSNVTGINGIFIGGLTVGNGSTGNQQGIKNSNITIENNMIGKAYTGIMVNGVSSPPSDSIYILNNIIGSDIASEYIGANGMFLKGMIRSRVSGNKIYNIISPYNNTLSGIHLEQDVTYSQVSENRISEIVNTAAASVGVYGIYSKAASNHHLLVNNNLITKVVGQGATTDISVGPVGIFLNNGYNYNILNNSVCLSGNRLDHSGSANCYSACLYVKNGMTDINVSNNIFKNVMTSSNTTGAGSNFGIVTGTTSVSSFSRLNNNLYYIASATPAMAVALALTGSTVRTDLSSWRSFSGLDRNSLWGQPGHVFDSVAEPDLTSVNSWNVNGRGYPFEEVTSDISGNPRSHVIATGSTDIGAVEFTPAVAPPNATASAAPAAGTTTYYTLGQDTLASISWTAASTVPSSISVKYHSGTNPPSPGNTLYMNAYWQIDATPNTGLDYSITLHYKPEAMHTVSESSLVMAKKDGTSPWVPYLSGTTTVNQASDIMTVTGLHSFSYFTGTDQNNPLPVNLLHFSGTKSGDQVILNWATAGQANCEYFDVERATASGSFSSIAKVRALTNKSTRTTYHFTDNHFPGNTNLAYRLKIIDQNGEVSYSEVVMVKHEQDHKQMLAAFPNPFSGKSFIQLSGSGKTTLEVRDLTGRLMASQTLEADGLYEIAGSEQWPAGIYFVTSSLSRETIKLIKAE